MIHDITHYERTKPESIRTENEKLIDVAMESARDLMHVNLELQGKLETVAKETDNKIPKLMLQQMPEYQKAMDALRAYSEAVVIKVNRIYKN